MFGVNQLSNEVAPPPELADAVRCEDTVDLFGWRFRITSMPFVRQGTQFPRCVHAAQWMVVAHSWMSHGILRRLPGEIYDAAHGGSPPCSGRSFLTATVTQFEPLENPIPPLAMHVDNFTYFSGVDGSAANQPSVPPGQAYRSARTAL